MDTPKNSLSIFSAGQMKRGRPQISPHGRLFGGDSLYEVLAELAANRGEKFSVLPLQDPAVIPLAMRIGRTSTQTRKEVRKLQRVGVLEEIDRLRKAEVYGIAQNEMAGARTVATRVTHRATRPVPCDRLGRGLTLT